MASSTPAWLSDLFGGAASGGGVPPLAGTNSIPQWGGYSGDQIGNAWRGAQGGMSGTDPIPQWGGYTGNQIGSAWQQAQQPKSLWDKITEGLGTIDPAKLKEAAKQLAGPGEQGAAAAPKFTPPVQTATGMYQPGYLRKPLDPKEALAQLIRGY